MTTQGQKPARRRGLARLWSGYGWLIMAALWVVALVLGYVGLALSAPGAGAFDLAYRTLQLISLESGDVAGASWQLNAARFLLPFLAGWTAVRALLSLFRDRWERALVRFWRNHVVICGLSRKGWLLAQGFAERGAQVAVIEVDESHDMIGPCRERGIAVLVGDATDPEVMRRAGVQRARQLVAVTDDDGTNAEVAVRARDLLQAAQAGSIAVRRRYPLTCTIHLVDPQLHELARAREMTLKEGVPLRLELFNVYEHAARLLWAQFGPPVDDAALPAGTPAGSGAAFHILVAGLGSLGQSLAVHAARDWYNRLHESPSRTGGRLRIGVVDQDADWKCRALSVRYPRLDGACDLTPWKMSVGRPEFYEAPFLDGGPDFPPVQAVFVCFDDDSLALHAGLSLQQRLLQAPTGPAPVVVRVSEAGGLGSLVEAGDDGPASANLHAFALLDSTCTPEALLRGRHEVLAQGLHQVYSEQQRALGQTGETNPSLVEWDQLPEHLRESNRAEADAILRHLAMLGYSLVPLTDWDAAFFVFPASEVEQLARSEHERFVNERLAQGWKHTTGPKDLAARLSPALVPWERLPEHERAKNREVARRLPATLARAGFQIVRLPAGSSASHPQPPGLPAVQHG